MRSEPCENQMSTAQAQENTLEAASVPRQVRNTAERPAGGCGSARAAEGKADALKRSSR